MTSLSVSKLKKSYSHGRSENLNFFSLLTESDVIVKFRLIFLTFIYYCYLMFLPNCGQRRNICKLWVSYWPTKHIPDSGSPSIFPKAKTEIVATAGTDQDTIWKYCDLASIASPDHFKTADKNQLTHNTSHHIEEDIVAKYKIMKRTVHDCFFVP